MEYSDKKIFENRALLNKWKREKNVKQGKAKSVEAQEFPYMLRYNECVTLYIIIRYVKFLLPQARVIELNITKRNP